MCGLFGWVKEEGVAGRNMEKERAMASILALANDMRGGDSWGYFTEDKLTKDVGEAFRMNRKKLNRLAASRWAIAHTRKATTGKVSKDNAHPFSIGAVVGAHNGIVANHDELNYMYDREFQVDSMHIFAHIDGGMPSFQDIEGYGAVTFCDTEFPGEVFVGTFNGGTLCVMRVEGFGIVWSSLEAHLNIALRATGLKGERVRLKEGRCYAIKDGAVEETKLDFDLTDPWYRYRNAAAQGILAKTEGGSSSSLLDYEDYEGWCKECGEFQEACLCTDKSIRR